MSRYVTRRTALGTPLAASSMTNESGGEHVAKSHRRSSPASSKMEAAESGRQHHHQQQDFTHINASLPGRRRRRRETAGTSCRLNNLLFRSIQRQTARYLRRNPEKVYALVILVCGTTLLLCLVTSALLQTQQQEQQPIPPSDERGIEQLPHEHHPERRKGLNLGSIWKTHGQQLKKKTISKKEIELFITRDHPIGVPVANKKPKIRSTHHQIRDSSATKEIDWSFDVLFSSLETTVATSETNKNHWNLPSMSREDIEEGGYEDYGDLRIHSLEEDDTYRRKIYDDPWLMENGYHTLQPDTENDVYYAFDDDRLRNEKLEGDQVERSCRRISEHRINYPNCNMFHETQFLDNNVKYLSEGAYRQVLIMHHHFEKREEKIIVKDIQYDHDFEVEGFEFVRMDAMVAERLSASPRIYDIYGFCGVGIISEFFSHGDLENIAIPGEGIPDPDHDTKPLKSYNELTGTQKLIISLQMAEAVADLHGFPGGVIVHQDIQLSQFLFNNAANKIILNDFNRAEFMLWDDEHQQYCKYTEGKGHGDWRSPEEFYDDPLDEKIDVFSLGNNMYSLLTGLWVFYDSKDDQETRKRVTGGEKPWIDPRYIDGDPAESKLAQIIPRCFEYFPEKRPSVFQLVEWLSEAVKEVLGAKGSDTNI
ncbi:protein kinase domain containing protein [Nitzschia inconspicua]|uniref:Protein kinase domain containing protein n=1 Tax=Nitzschia inconspicua TaxID=303405 RepID=A0A9K3LLB8_9STRA|nr:protein kinase domain containing protein [Nitzschia inconspicua]